MHKKAMEEMNRTLYAVAQEFGYTPQRGLLYREAPTTSASFREH